MAEQGVPYKEDDEFEDFTEDQLQSSVNIKQVIFFEICFSSLNWLLFYSY